METTATGMAEIFGVETFEAARYWRQVDALVDSGAANYHTARQMASELPAELSPSSTGPISRSDQAPGTPSVAVIPRPRSAYIQEALLDADGALNEAALPPLSDKALSLIEAIQGARYASQLRRDVWTDILCAKLSPQELQRVLDARTKRFAELVIHTVASERPED
jgi:hypothetical protein